MVVGMLRGRVVTHTASGAGELIFGAPVSDLLVDLVSADGRECEVPV